MRVPVNHLSPQTRRHPRTTLTLTGRSGITGRFRRFCLTSLAKGAGDNVQTEATLREGALTR
jgi:hypothetical protein